MKLKDTHTQKLISFNEYFSYISIINLRDRIDRKIEIEHQLKKISLSFSSVGVELYTSVKPIITNGFPSNGAYGCFISHLAVLKQALAHKVARVLILEDDVDFIDNRLLELPIILDDLSKQDWDICYLGNELNIESNSGELFVNYQQDIICAHLYAVQGKVLPELIAFLETVLTRSPGDPAGGPMHYDGALNTFRSQNPSIKTLVLRNPIGLQRSSRTDIHPLRFYDRMPVIKTIVTLLRKFKNTKLRF